VSPCAGPAIILAILFIDIICSPINVSSKFSTKIKHYIDVEPLAFVVRMTTNSRGAVWVFIVELHCISTHHNIDLVSNILMDISNAERNLLLIPCHLFVSLLKLSKYTNGTKKGNMKAIFIEIIIVGVYH
jgi:hypothetical protein